MHLSLVLMPLNLTVKLGSDDNYTPEGQSVVHTFLLLMSAFCSENEILPDYSRWQITEVIEFAVMFWCHESSINNETHLHLPYFSCSFFETSAIVKGGGVEWRLSACTPTSTNSPLLIPTPIFVGGHWVVTTHQSWILFVCLFFKWSVPMQSWE